ncbi:MAG: hemerythrin domain-containing protein [Sporichthyaceae bacterium]
MSNDAIVLLREDHKQLKALFREFRGAGKDATATKGRLVEQMIELLTVHTYIENEGMYPQVRTLVPEIESEILESYEEHHVADLLCVELVAMTPEHERFDAKVSVLMENVEHHIQEEEDVWFPKVREALGRKELQQLGEEMLTLRERAPRHPAQPGALKKAVHAVIG